MGIQSVGLEVNVAKLPVEYASSPHFRLHLRTELQRGQQMIRHQGLLFGWLVAVFCALVLLAACDTGKHDVDPEDRAHVDAMSREHADDSATPSGAADVQPERAVVAETLPYAEVNEELVYGHFVFPADMVDPLPALIVVHEWWGLNDGVRAVADRLAAAGYIVLAVDLFGGKSAATNAEASALMVGVVENPEDASENIRLAYKFLQETAGAPKVASLGWCFGGGWSLNTAMMLSDDLDAAVIYYGQVTDDEELLRPISAPILGLFGANDLGIKVDTVRAFEAALENLGKDYEIEIYSGVGHAFANPTGNNYNAAVANLAWDKTLEFLGKHLTDDEQ